MMAIAKYKVVREFEFEGKNLGLGEELVLKDADGEALVQKGKLQLSNYLDPENTEDKAVIDSFQKKEEEASAEYNAKQEARDEATQENIKADEEKAVEDAPVENSEEVAADEAVDSEEKTPEENTSADVDEEKSEEASAE
jgi:hypothetical protein